MPAPAATIALLALAAVSLDIEDNELSAREMSALSAEISAAISERLGEPPVLAGCRRCEESVRITIDVGPTRMQVVAERRRGTELITRHATVGPRELSAWRAPARALASALFPERLLAPSGLTILSPATPPHHAPPYLESVLIGAGVVAAGFAVFFAIDGSSARGEIGRGLVTSPELESLESRANQHTAFSFGLSAAALTLAGTGLGLLIGR